MTLPAAAPGDVSTLDEIIRATYDVISGPAGQARNWDRFRSLFVPGARLMPVINAAGEKPRVRVLTPEDYIRRVDPIFALEDFWERESGREIKRLGRIAHVLSHYASLRDPRGESFDHGTNSMQAFYDDARWWVVSIMWNTERPE